MNSIVDKKHRYSFIPHKYSQAELVQRTILYIFNEYLESINVFHFKK